MTDSHCNGTLEPLINNLEDIFVFLGLKVGVFSYNFFPALEMLNCHLCRETTIKTLSFTI